MTLHPEGYGTRLVTIEQMVAKHAVVKTTSGGPIHSGEIEPPLSGRVKEIKPTPVLRGVILQTGSRADL